MVASMRDLTIKTFLVQEDETSGCFYINYGIHIFRYTPPAAEGKRGHLTKTSGRTDVFECNSPTLESALGTIGRRFDSGITISPGEDRRDG